MFFLPYLKKTKTKTLFFADSKACTFMWNIQLMKKKKEKHTKNPRGNPINIVLGEDGAFLVCQVLCQMLSHFILTKTLGGGYFYYRSFMGEASKAQRG